MFFIGLITLKRLLCKVWQAVLEHFNVHFGPISFFSTTSSQLLQAILFYGSADVAPGRKSLCRTEVRENAKNSPVGKTK